MASFVVDMAKVFEDFVGTALTEALRRYPADDPAAVPGASPRRGGRLEQGQDGGRRRAPRRRAAAPGLRRQVQGRGRCGAYPNADHYQMLAYCTALQVPTAWLVYAGGGLPRGAGSGTPTITVIE